MFELSIAWKYLLPKRRQLSVSIISLISVLVISLVIWLILVFFSVTKGLEKGWIEKLVALTAPVKIVPTEEYYNSYYYQIDQLSQESNYTLRSIAEKKLASKTDPYDNGSDEELPADFPKADLDSSGHVKDLVKLAYQAIDEIPGIQAGEYEVTSANIRLRLLRGGVQATQSFLSQPIYFASIDSKNQAFTKSLLPFNERDFSNALSLLSISQEGETADSPVGWNSLQIAVAEKRKRTFTEQLNYKKDIAEALQTLNTKTYQEKDPLPFYAVYKKQNQELIQHELPFDPVAGHGILVPKSFRDGGLLLGDRGYIGYFAPSPSGVQEQRQPVFIAGFYDPGIVPLGGKFVLGAPTIVRTIRAAQAQESTPMTNGINIYLTDLAQAEKVKEALTKALEQKGIANYWKVESFRDYDYAKDLLQQLRSEKNIFSLIAIVIIIVACSNIVSMLIILVKDKRAEIGILKAMGATSQSIATIFGFCGVVMGFVGTLVGTGLAFFTLRHLNDLLRLISQAQGYQAFNPMFYGENMPNAMSYETLGSVLVATLIISCISGLIPAFMATRIQPVAILRSE